MTDTSNNPPKYGYQNTTPELDTNPKVTHHVVTITGLNPLTTYYFRVVSRGSLAYGWEYQFKLVQEIIPPQIVEVPLNNQVAFGNVASGQGVSNEEGQTLENEEQIEDQGSEELQETTPQTAALGFAPGLRAFLGWIWQNLWWLILLLLIILAIYYYWKKNKDKNQNNN